MKHGKLFMNYNGIMRLSILLLVLVLGCLSAEAQEKCNIRGKIKNLEDGVTLILFRSAGRALSPVATDTVRNGAFHFQVDTENQATEAFLLLSANEGFPSIWLEVWGAPGKNVKIAGEGKLIQSWRAESNLPEQKSANRYVRLSPEWTVELQQILIKIKELAKGEDEQLVANEYKKLNQQLDSVRLLITAREVKMMEHAPIDIVWLRKMKDICYMSYYMKDQFPYKKEALSLYQRITDENRQTGIGKEITAYLFPPTVVQVGEQMADGDLFDLKGQVHHLSDYAGKYILLDFWSCGCGPCMMALPEMKEVAEKNRERLVVVSLNTDNKKAWEEVSREKDISWENLNDLQGGSGLAMRYGVQGIPYYVIISPTGKILYSWAGYGKGLITSVLHKWMQQEEK